MVTIYTYAGIPTVDTTILTHKDLFCPYSFVEHQFELEKRVTNLLHVTITSCNCTIVKWVSNGGQLRLP